LREFFINVFFEILSYQFLFNFNGIFKFNIVQLPFSETQYSIMSVLSYFIQSANNDEDTELVSYLLLTFRATQIPFLISNYAAVDNEPLLNSCQRAIRQSHSSHSISSISLSPSNYVQRDFYSLNRKQKFLLFLSPPPSTAALCSAIQINKQKTQTSRK
jgi:hypothetical protein